MTNSQTSPTVKISVPLEADLFAQLETLAEELKISPNRLLILAIEAFIERHQNQQMLTHQLNTVYDEAILPTTPEEKQLLQKMRHIHKQLVAEDPY